MTAPIPFLAHPLQLSYNGSFLTVEQDTDAHVAQQIAAIVATRVGERPMAPTFGIPDPVWAGVNVEDIQTQVDEFDIGVTIEAVDTTADTVDMLTSTVSITADIAVRWGR